jgi:hypothetical protein
LQGCCMTGPCCEKSEAGDRYCQFQGKFKCDRKCECWGTPGRPGCCI